MSLPMCGKLRATIIASSLAHIASKISLRYDSSECVTPPPILGICKSKTPAQFFFNFWRLAALHLEIFFPRVGRWSIFFGCSLCVFSTTVVFPNFSVRLAAPQLEQHATKPKLTLAQVGNIKKRNDPTRGKSPIWVATLWYAAARG